MKTDSEGHAAYALATLRRILFSMGLIRALLMLRPVGSIFTIISDTYTTNTVLFLSAGDSVHAHLEGLYHVYLLASHVRALLVP